MKIVTIDASAAASWLLPKQRGFKADAFLESGAYDRLIAPEIFIWEIGNLMARRLDDDDRDVALQTLSLIEIDVAQPRSRDAVLNLVGTAVRRRLTLFDTAYLQICLEMNAALASRDARLLEAAEIAGVEVFDLRD